MRVFLNGATGFVGSRTLDHLLADDIEVVALVRDPGRLAPRPGLRVVTGSRERVHERVDHLAACDAVCTSLESSTPGAPATFARVVVQGTRDLLDAAARAGVPRYVYVSSEAVHQAGQPLLDVDESSPLPTRASSAYGDAKRRVEEVVPAHPGPMARLVLRPTCVWGTDSAPLAGLIGHARHGRLPLL